MVSLKFIQLIIASLTNLLAYIMIVSPVGWFRAWVAEKMGDSTAEDMGFLTLNPAMHIDTVGVILLLLPMFGVGWGKHVPINPNNIHGNHRGIKIGFAYFSDTIAHIVVASLALLCFILIFGTQSLSIYASAVSSLSISVGRILWAFISLNVFLAVIAIVINTMMIITWYIAEKNIEFPPLFFYFFIFAPMLVLLLFGENLRTCVFGLIVLLGNLFACILGIK